MATCQAIGRHTSDDQQHKAQAAPGAKSGHVAGITQLSAAQIGEGQHEGQLWRLLLRRRGTGSLGW